MKRFFKTFTSILLVSLLVVTSVPAAVFAGSSSSEEIDHSDHQTTLSKFDTSGKFPCAMNDGNSKDYMMVIEHGPNCDCAIQSIIIKYKGVGSSDIATQVINPYGGYTSDLYIGSKDYTYKNALENTYYTTDSGASFKKDFTGYLNTAKKLVSAGLDSYTDPMNVCSTGIQSNDTEYFEFRLEYTLDSLESVTFNVFPAKSTMTDWTVFNWGIYDVTNVKATTFARVSDRVGIKFDGTCLFETTKATNSKLQEIGIAGGKALAISFYNKASLPASLVEKDRKGKEITYPFNTTEEEYVRDMNGLPDYIGSTGDVYRSDMGAGDLELLCFEKKGTSVATRSRIYNFCINLADQYDGGIESFVRDNSTQKIDIQELLNARIVYRTTAGTQQTVNLPVITNSILEYYYSDSDTAPEGGLTGLTFAQQGETLCFSVEFPDIATLEWIDLKFKNTVSGTDMIGIQNILVYDNWGSNDYIKKSNYKDLSGGVSMYMSIEESDVPSTLVFAADEGEPVWFNGFGDNLQMDFYEPDNLAGYSESYVPSRIDHTGEYLVQITTDDVPGVGTQARVNVELEYELLNGNIDSTGYIALNEAYQEFNGYIRGNATNYTARLTDDKYKTFVTDDKGQIVYDSTSKVIDAGYESAMSEGETISFYVDVGDIKQFTGLNIEIEDSPDDWQPGSISIIKINEDTQIGKRCIDVNAGKTLVGTSGNKTKSDIVTGYGYSRQVVKGEYVITNHRLGFTLKNGMEMHEDLITGEHQGEEKKREDYSEFKTEMDYATACSDLKLNVAVKTYEMRVKVASNATASAGTDNCGSANLFYFQLIFSTGQSAYVLANQQLDADGFRSGQTEVFYISTNEDLGDVVAVNIIADDVSANASPIDKLCIEKLEVIKHNDSTLNKIFTVDNIGWITTEYTDTSESSVKRTRSEADLAHSFTDISIGYAMDLEFALTIGDNPLEFPENFEGYVTMDFTYQTQTKNGAYKEKSIKGINIVQAMYEYRDDTPLIDKNQNVISDDKMFRPGTIDRFRVTITDCRVLRSIRFHGYPYDNNGCLYISDVNVSMCLSDGKMSQVKSADGLSTEMTRVYDEGKEPKLIGQLKNRPTGAYQYSYGGDTFLKLDFDSGSVVPDMDPDTKIGSIVPREPNSQNDTLNLFLYLADEVPEPGVQYDLTTEIMYETVESASTYNSTKVSGYVHNMEGKHWVLSKTGIMAPKFSVLRNVMLTCSVINNNNLQADHAIVQHVRNGVVIDTYTIRFAGSIFGRNMGLSMLSAISAKDSGVKQVVTLQLGADTPVMNLSKEENDIAVALEYKSKSLIGKDTETYTSTNVFATDSGTTSIHPGSILTFEFNEVNVQEVTAIKIVGVGNVTGTFNGANIKMYEPDANDQVALAGWYSVDAPSTSKTTKNTEYTIGPKTLRATVGGFVKDSVKSLKLIEFTFLTTEVSELRDSSGTVPIRAKVMYKQTNGGTGVYEIDDIRQYVSSGEGFISGAETTVSMFLPGLKSLRSIELEPYDYDEDTAVSWNLDMVKYKAEGVDDESLHTMPVKKTIVENKGVNLNLSTIYLDLKVTNEGVVYETVNGTVDISAEEGVTLTFTPTIYESSAGYKVSVYKVIGGGLEQIKSYGSDTPSFNYKVTNDGTDNLTYRFVVQSNENPAVEAVVNVTVPPVKDPLLMNKGENNNSLEEENGEDTEDKTE